MNPDVVKVTGRITDFQNNPQANAIVRIMDDHFEDIESTYTDDNGYYQLTISKGVYYAFYACKDYAIRNLEYWAWNVPVHEDSEINARIDGLEIYSLTAFRAQFGLPQMMIYFRPMSLKKGKPFKENAELLNQPIVDIAPNITEHDVEVRINGIPSVIHQVNKVFEYVGSGKMYAYLLHVSAPIDLNRYEYNKIDVVVADRETGEQGEGSVYWKEERKAGKQG